MAFRELEEQIRALQRRISEILTRLGLIEPTGTMTPFAGSIAPTGWLLADGSAVSRTTYADLFAVIGTTYGVGNGSSTFNLPNTKGRTLVGRDTTQAEFNALGKTGGEKAHTLTVAEMPSHAHRTGISPDTSMAASPGANSAIVLFSQTLSLSQSTGGDAPHNNLQPYLAVNYLIKT